MLSLHPLKKGAGVYDNGIEHSGSIYTGDFLTNWGTNVFSRMTTFR